MLRALVLLISATVGVTAWTSAPAPAPMPMPPTWSDTIDAWEGLCSAADALVDADSLKLPCLYGPGARRPPELDSIAAGVGRVKVARVTDYSNTSGAGSLRAAMDSAEVWKDGKTCTVIVFAAGGGDVYFESTGQNADENLACVYIAGQTAQGEGINIEAGGDLRARKVRDIYVGYTYDRRPGDNESWILGGSSDMQCSSGIYAEHMSRSWATGSSGVNLITGGCGTSFVPDTGWVSRDWTLSRNLLFEGDSVHATFIHTGGTNQDPSGVYAGSAKFANVLVHENYMATGADRTPLFGNTDSMQVVGNVAYNIENGFVRIGSSRNPVESRLDLISNYYRYGPYTQFYSTSTATTRARGWATYFYDALLSSDSIALHARNLRTYQNDYDSLSTPDSLFRGGERSVACDDDVGLNASYCNQNGDSIPPEVYTGVTDTMSLGGFTRSQRDEGSAFVNIYIPHRPPSFEAITDVRAEHIIQIAGNSRYLDCDGTWTLRADSVDTRARTEWVDSTGTSADTDLNTATDRSYGTPATGTPCPDADSDGLPNAYETAVTGSSTALAPDSVANGLPAILWYISGRDLDGSLIGCSGCSAESGGGGGSSTATFGAVNRWVYLVNTQSLFGLTMENFSPLSQVRFTVWNPAADSVLVVTCSDQGTPTDSATVHARLVAWARPGISTAAELRDYDPYPDVGC